MTLWKLPVVVIFRENSYFSPAFMKKQWTCCVIKKVAFKLCHLISLLIVYTPWFFAVGTNRYLPVRSNREIWDLGSSIRRYNKEAWTWCGDQDSSSFHHCLANAASFASWSPEDYVVVDNCKHCCVVPDASCIEPRMAVPCPGKSSRHFSWGTIRFWHASEV